ncbi:MAG: hypothetical protein PCFJNLEI_02382 [Verrucomicrobiae bacterium]|nr:hypothetical protein [Verrucomicrobiae bacterium]
MPSGTEPPQSTDVLLRCVSVLAELARSECVWHIGRHDEPHAEESRKVKPRLFVGSSAESKAIAYAIHENLDYDATVNVWTDDIFKPSKTALDSLLDAVSKHEFAALVFSPDDTTKLRDATFKTARDNVSVELSLFIGRHGKEHAFIVLPRNVKDFHLPSDFVGFTPVTYDQDRAIREPVPALRPACQQILRAMRDCLNAKPTVQVAVKHGRKDTDTFKCKLYLTISNHTGKSVLLSSAAFRGGKVLRLDKGMKPDVTTGLAHLKFINAAKTDMTEPQYLLRDNESTYVWVGIDPSHTDAEIADAIAKHQIGEFVLDCAWPGANSVTILV